MVVDNNDNDDNDDNDDNNNDNENNNNNNNNKTRARLTVIASEDLLGIKIEFNRISSK